MASKGELIVEEAKKHLGKPYEFGAEGPYKFDCSGFVKYVFNNAINYGMKERRASIQSTLGVDVSNRTPMAGDLVFFKDTYNSGNVPNISHVGIFLGEGTNFIQASGSKVNISNLDNNYWKSHYYSTRRLLNPNETFSDGKGNVPGYVSDNPSDVMIGLSGDLPLSGMYEYRETLQSSLESLNNSNDSYCSLVDLTRGGEFKFHMPQSFTESIPITWENNSGVLGRSVPVVGYTNSGPRSIPLEVDLMVGEGYYKIPNKSHDDIMEIMYKDIRFVKSLVYPDYDFTIVQPPSLVLLSIGTNVKLKGVVNNLSINYQKPIDSKNRSMHVTLSFTVSQVSDEPPGRSDILNNTTRSY